MLMVAVLSLISDLCHYFGIESLTREKNLSENFSMKSSVKDREQHQYG
jgi:hypothetical protein